MEEHLEETQPVEAEPVEQVGEEEQAGTFASKIGAENLNFVNSFTMGANARQDLTMNRSMAFGAAAGGDMVASDSLVLSAAVGHDVTLTDSVAGFLNSGGNVNMTDGGSVMMVGGEVTAQKSSMGVVIANHLTIEDGSHVSVSMTMKQALAFGAAFGAVFAVLSRLFRRR